MPVVSAPLPEVDQSITRPVVLDIVRQIKAITGIPDEIVVNYIAQGEARSQYGSTAGSQDDTTRLSSAPMITIEVEDTYDEGFFTTNPGHRPEQLPDFIDNRLGIVIKPIYAVCNLSVVFTYRTPSRNEALRWRDDAQFHASQMRDVVLHELTYHYLLPNPYWTLLKHIYDLREAQGGYGQTFEQYIMDGLTSRATQITSLNGEFQRTAIRETQGRVQGFFDFQAQPEKQDKNNDKGAWEIHFTYQFSFSKPVRSSMRYPIVVHNQLIDEKFIPEMIVDHEKQQARMALSTNALHYFEAPQVQQRLIGPKQLRMAPAFDDWQPDSWPLNVEPQLCLMAGVSTDKLGVILNLNDLGEYTIDQDILDFIQGIEYRYVNKLHTSLVQVNVFKDGYMIGFDRFAVEPDLKIRMSEPVNIRSVYRVMVSFSNDISKVDPRAIKRLMLFPKAYAKLIRQCCKNRGELRRLLPMFDIERDFMDLPDVGHSRQDVLDAIISRKTVMSGYVQTQTSS